MSPLHLFTQSACSRRKRLAILIERDGLGQRDGLGSWRRGVVQVWSSVDRAPTCKAWREAAPLAFALNGRNGTDVITEYTHKAETNVGVTGLPGQRVASAEPKPNGAQVQRVPSGKS